MHKTAYLLLGGNIDDRLYFLERALDMLNNLAGKIKSVSNVYESEPWGFESSQWFLNQAVELETNLMPLILLEKIKLIEKYLGRIRTAEVYQSRTIDIDIVLYNSAIFNSPELVIPHPRMTERMFVLLPMAEIAPDIHHPIYNCSVAYLKEHCCDMSKINIFKQ